MNAGDVVFGAFPVKGETLADHHSVVVEVNGDQALLVYTTSIKPGESQIRRVLSREFSPVERELANWRNPCRYDATKVAVVPVHLLHIEGRVPTATVKELSQEIRLAAQQKRLEMNAYNPNHPVRMTGAAARLKREAALQ